MEDGPDGIGRKAGFLEGAAGREGSTNLTGPRESGCSRSLSYWVFFITFIMTFLGV
jgi:hypothetical protein